MNHDGLSFLEYSEQSTAYNLAIEEALLFKVIETRKPILRLWQSQETAVVLGVGKPYKKEAFAQHCQDDQVPILRRISGGGTVLHLQGNLNFSYFLPLELYPQCSHIDDSYQWVFQNIQNILPELKDKLTFNGHSDFCIGQKKFSGNAQARRKNTLLHHGTILCHCQLDQIPKYLQMPEVRPEYRKDLSHEHFLCTLQSEIKTLSMDLLVQRFQEQCSSCITYESLYISQTAKQLLSDKYSDNSWNLKL